MGLPPSFAKAAQAASQVLAGFDLDAFRIILENNPIGIVWDDRVIASLEGLATLDLTVDLIARLYPEIRLGCYGDKARERMAFVKAQIRSINPNVALSERLEDGAVNVVIGNTPIDRTIAQHSCTIYVGSDQWIAKLSRSGPVSCGDSQNVFGAGVAACFAAANVFRSVFVQQLMPGGLDQDLSLSLIDFENSRNPENVLTNPPLPDVIDLGETRLVGVGALGHAAVWAWRRTPGLRGVLNLIDPEAYDDTNPQRYVGISHDASGQKATAASAGKWMSNDLLVAPHDKDWSAYVATVGEAANWRFDRVALALDTAEDRVLVQATLPRVIHNAWTRPENVGVSRHDFLAGPCVSCIYLPSGSKPNYDEIVAHSFRIMDPLEVKRVRFYLDTGAPLDAPALEWIADRLDLVPEKRERLNEFLGCPLEELYAKGVCGGVFLSVGDAEVSQVEVPLAFQSALGGILLAAEVVIDAAGLRHVNLPARTEINLLRPLGSRLNSPQQPPASVKCLCQDKDYRTVYESKYCSSAGILE